MVVFRCSGKTRVYVAVDRVPPCLARDKIATQQNISHIHVATTLCKHSPIFDSANLWPETAETLYLAWHQYVFRILILVILATLWKEPFDYLTMFFDQQCLGCKPIHRMRWRIVSWMLCINVTEGRLSQLALLLTDQRILWKPPVLKICSPDETLFASYLLVANPSYIPFPWETTKNQVLYKTFFHRLHFYCVFCFFSLIFFFMASWFPSSLMDITCLSMYVLFVRDTCYL